FFLLFSTIHYEKYGGFQELLNGVWEVLPEGTPLIGGTVAGFMNNYGCFARGATGLAVHYPDMRVSIGVGHNTKRNPKKAVEECIDMLRAKDSLNKTEFYIEIVSGPVIPSFPGVGRQTVIKSKTMGRVMEKALPTLWKSNMGTDRADEILEHISAQIDKPLIGLVSIDNGKLLKNYQFLDREVLENTLLLMGVSTQLKPSFFSTSALVPRGIKVKISTKKDRRTVVRINDKEATPELYRLLGWDEKSVREVEKFYTQAFYYPFGSLREGKIHAYMIGLILGSHVYFANKIESNELELYSLTADQILLETQKIFSREAKLIYGVMCETYIETLGSRIYEIKNIADKTHSDYLILFGGGESLILEDGTPHHLYESINLISFQDI
ncbi:MAG: hypothetical protein DRN18_02875, partial [Thermoplasmata archaeon]